MKCEVMELRCFIITMHEDVKTANSSQEEAIVHGFPSTLATRVTKLTDVLKVVEK